MRFLITSISGKKGYKSFKNLNEYVEFMTKKGHLVKDLKEADLPYTDKPVKLPKVSKSNGWSEVTDFGEVGEEAEKGESLIASTSKSVMKDEASFEMSKSSGKADKSEMGLGAEKGDVDMSDFKSFEYEEPKLKSSETKESAPKNEESKSEEKTEPKKEESKEDKKETNKSSEKKENKEEKMNKEDKDIEECLRAAGVKPLNEGFLSTFLIGIGSLWAIEKIIKIIALYAIKSKYKKLKQIVDQWQEEAKKFDNMSKEEQEEFLSRMGSYIDNSKFIPSLIKAQIKEICTNQGNISDFANEKINWEFNGKKLNEGIKDYLPRAGFIRDDDEDKDSRKMGIWGGQGTDEQLRKAKIIAKVKFANGDRMGRVTKEDLDNFEDYKAQYDEIYGSDEELDEGWKDKFKKGAATLGVAASLAGNAMAHDPMYDGARNPNTDDVEIAYSQSENESPRMVNKKGAMIIDQFGNEWTEREWNKLINGEDPYSDGARNPQIEESDDDMLNVDIAECLKAAGVKI